MILVIELLQKELERQNLLIAADKIKEQKKIELGDEYKCGPFLSEIYPNMVQLRDQIEDAISFLKTKA